MLLTAEASKSDLSSESLDSGLQRCPWSGGDRLDKAPQHGRPALCICEKPLLLQLSFCHFNAPPLHLTRLQRLRWMGSC
jgi:hypothetical protein